MAFAVSRSAAGEFTCTTTHAKLQHEQNYGQSAKLKKKRKAFHTATLLSTSNSMQTHQTPKPNTKEHSKPKPT